MNLPLLLLALSVLVLACSAVYLTGRRREAERVAAAAERARLADTRRNVRVIHPTPTAGA